MTAAGLRVLSSLALKGALEQFRAQLGTPELYFDATQAILPRLRQGEPADLLILTREAIDELQREGRVRQAWLLGSSGVGVAVKAGAPRPDIATLPSFIAALERAGSVAHSRVGASGLYFAELVERLGVRLRKRVVVESGPVGRVVASGEAELGVQQLCELAPVPGIDIVGPLPEPVQKLTWFSAGIPAGAARAADAARLVEGLQRVIGETPALRISPARSG